MVVVLTVRVEMMGVVVIVIAMVVMVVMGRMGGGDDSHGGAGGDSMSSSEGFGNTLVSGTYSGFLNGCSSCHLGFMVPSSWSDDHSFVFFCPLPALF